jgi:hypothetical protein
MGKAGRGVVSSTVLVVIWLSVAGRCRRCDGWGARTSLTLRVATTLFTILTSFKRRRRGLKRWPRAR